MQHTIKSVKFTSELYTHHEDLDLLLVNRSHTRAFVS